jgi:hypothetical protein
VLLKDLSFGVISYDLWVDEAAQIEALRSELSHTGLRRIQADALLITE